MFARDLRAVSPRGNFPRVAPSEGSRETFAAADSISTFSSFLSGGIFRGLLPSTLAAFYTADLRAARVRTSRAVIRKKHEEKKEEARAVEGLHTVVYNGVEKMDYTALKFRCALSLSRVFTDPVRSTGVSSVTRTYR